MKFQFDDDGGRFLYFIISVYAIILIPITLIIFPRRKYKRMQLCSKLTYYFVEFIVFN